MMSFVGFTHIVVGVDFTDSSLEACRMALHLARQQGVVGQDSAKVTFVHVGVVPELPHGIPTSLSQTAMEYIRLAKASLNKDRDSLGDWFERFDGQGVDIQLMVVEGHPAEAVVKAADSLKADLICAGSNNRKGVVRFALGSVSERLVRVANCDVLIVREGDVGRGGFKSMVVGMDFSKSSLNALDSALCLASNDAVVQVVHCIEPIDVGGQIADLGQDSMEELDQAVTEAMEIKGQNLLKKYSGSGKNIRFEIMKSPPNEGLHRLSNERNVDVLVVASRGETGLRRVLLGSVSEASVRHAKCSVLVCPSRRSEDE